MSQAGTYGSGGGGGGNPIHWQVVSTDTTMATLNGYITDSSSNINLTLPLTPSVGDSIYIQGYGIGGWTVVQPGSSTVIHFGIFDTTVGTSGGLSSTQQYDGLWLLCVQPNEWAVREPDGNITVF